MVTPGRGPYVLAVCGGSGSGKTTVVNALKEACGEGKLAVLAQDHYYHDLSNISPSERKLRNFDHPDAIDFELMRYHVECLAAGQAIDRPTYDFVSHTRTGATTRLESAPVVVLDGILALHDQMLRQSFHLSVFVDVPDDVRLGRRLRRDVAERGRNMDDVLTQYLTSVKPMHDLFVAPQRQFANFIVSWEHRNNPAIETLAAILRQKIG